MTSTPPSSTSVRLPQPTDYCYPYYVRLKGHRPGQTVFIPWDERPHDGVRADLVEAARALGWRLQFAAPTPEGVKVTIHDATEPASFREYQRRPRSSALARHSPEGQRLVQVLKEQGRSKEWLRKQPNIGRHLPAGVMSRPYLYRLLVPEDDPLAAPIPDWFWPEVAKALNVPSSTFVRRRQRRVASA